MALSVSSITSSFSSLSFASQISPSKSFKLSLPRLSFPPISSKRNPNPSSISASAATISAVPDLEEDGISLEKYVKARLPGGFAAQTIFGTGRRKCAIARVVLQEGTGKVIINYRDAKEYLQGNPLWLQ
ncbi:30S ribosomal protein S9, chloroplastic-like [Iris pallida]|uniref:30S ribosomal protein S9, chloroplastic-like n=1 Tax=Iris pallida TaxID=29817 RepID=A0AAX6HWX0_IRIPA|nr:30S ribosomal protein S9, chloroplastic-like [Iris pallida]